MKWQLWGGTVQAILSNANAIWANIIAEGMEDFVKAANAPTIFWFENSPDWKLVKHHGIDWKWVKE